MGVRTMRRQKRAPAYLLHQATGQARVRINGKDHYLGPFASPESKALYREKLEEWGCGEKLWGMIQLQLLTGMGPGEVRIMCLEDIDRTGDVWEYVPPEHKTEHRGKQRRIYIGPEGQKILLPFLKADQSRYLFETAAGLPFTKDG